MGWLLQKVVLNARDALVAVWQRDGAIAPLASSFRTNSF